MKTKRARRARPKAAPETHVEASGGDERVAEAIVGVAVVPSVYSPPPPPVEAGDIPTIMGVAVKLRRENRARGAVFQARWTIKCPMEGHEGCDKSRGVKMDVDMLLRCFPSPLFS